MRLWMCRSEECVRFCMEMGRSCPFASTGDSLSLNVTNQNACLFDGHTLFMMPSIPQHINLLEVRHKHCRQT